MLLTFCASVYSLSPFFSYFYLFVAPTWGFYLQFFCSLVAILPPPLSCCPSPEIVSSPADSTDVHGADAARCYHGAEVPIQFPCHIRSSQHAAGSHFGCHHHRHCQPPLCRQQMARLDRWGSCPLTLWIFCLYSFEWKNQLNKDLMPLCVLFLCLNNFSIESFLK